MKTTRQGIEIQSSDATEDRDLQKEQENNIVG